MSAKTAIKLFGKTISLPSTDFSIDSTKAAASSSSSSSSSSSTSSIHLQHLSDEQQQKPLPSEEIIKQENGATCENPNTPSVDKEASALESPTKEEQSDTSNNSSQEKTLVKPDQIVPCPRCNSMDTKFCYFNNYNVNQPRHFCRRCQRYWTAGGAMRNVPVGAGRRKNKQLSLVPHYEQILQPRVNLGSNESTKPLVSNLIQKGINDNSQNLPGYNPLQAPRCIAPPRLPGFHASLSHPSTYLMSFPTFPGSWNSPSIFSSNPSSETLGKHSRDEKSDHGVWVPKTLRINDPSEAAKSSIWASLGHKNEKSTSKNVGGLFNDLHSTGNNQHENRVTDQVSVLQANPAAMSRSHNFHETA